jgi:hypothetical protein
VARPGLTGVRGVSNAIHQGIGFVAAADSIRIDFVVVD